MIIVPLKLLLFVIESIIWLALGNCANRELNNKEQINSDTNRFIWDKLAKTLHVSLIYQYLVAEKNIKYLGYLILFLIDLLFQLFSFI